MLPARMSARVTIMVRLRRRPSASRPRTGVAIAPDSSAEARSDVADDVNTIEPPPPRASMCPISYLRHSPRPGIVVVHEAFGLNDHIRDVGRQLAAGRPVTTRSPPTSTPA